MSTRIVAWTYVAVWVAGLAIAPSGPASSSAARTVQAYYRDHAGAVLAQSLLVHGAAGLCLLILAWQLARRGTRPWLARTVVVTGVGAAVVSWVQVAFAVLAVHAASAGSGSVAGAAAASSGWFTAVNVADAVKLCLLAVFVAAVTAARRSRWLTAVAVLLMPLLPLGAAAFLVDNGVLTGLLTISLPLLLVWVGSLGVLRPLRPVAVTGWTGASLGVRP